MRSIAFLSQKGGSGKTTLAAHVAVAAGEARETVIALDTDPQDSAYAWGQVRKADTPKIIKATAATFRRVIDGLAQDNPTLTVFDSAPHAAAGRPAPFVLSACDPRIPKVTETRTMLARHGFPVAPVDICHHIVFARAVASGQSVTECDAQGKAAAERVAF